MGNQPLPCDMNTSTDQLCRDEGDTKNVIIYPPQNGISEWEIPTVETLDDSNPLLDILLINHTVKALIEADYDQEDKVLTLTISAEEVEEAEEEEVQDKPTEESEPSDNDYNPPSQEQPDPEPPKEEDKAEPVIY